MRRVSPVRPARARGGYKAAREGCRGPRGLCATASGRVKCGCGARARVCDCARAAARPRVGGRCDRRPRIGRAAPVKEPRGPRGTPASGAISRARVRAAPSRASGPAWRNMFSPCRTPPPSDNSAPGVSPGASATPACVVITTGTGGKNRRSRALTRWREALCCSARRSARLGSAADDVAGNGAGGVDGDATDGVVEVCGARARARAYPLTPSRGGRACVRPRVLYNILYNVLYNILYNIVISPCVL